MSSTVYPIISVPATGRKEINDIFTSILKGHTYDGKALYDILTKKGWKPNIGDTPDNPRQDSICIWGSDQLEVFEYEMPDGRKYLVYGYQDETDPETSIEPFVLCPSDDDQNLVLVGFEPEGKTVTVTYGEARDIFCFDKGYTPGTAVVGQGNAKRMTRHCVPAYEEYRYMDGIRERCIRDFGAEEVIFHKQVAVPDEAFED